MENKELHPTPASKEKPDFEEAAESWYLKNYSDVLLFAPCFGGFYVVVPADRSTSGGKR